jgi:hypothetical protein
VNTFAPEGRVVGARVHFTVKVDCELRRFGDFSR